MFLGKSLGLVQVAMSLLMSIGNQRPFAFGTSDTSFSVPTVLLLRVHHAGVQRYIEANAETAVGVEIHLFLFRSHTQHLLRVSWRQFYAGSAV